MAVLDPNDLLQQQQNEETTKLQLITPIIQAKWQTTDKIIMEYKYTAGRISIDEYNVAHRGKEKKVDYLLLWKDNVLLALVEAKGREHSAGDGYQQAIDYANDLDVPFAYATNGIELIEKDMITGINKHMKIEEFPGPDELWDRYLKEKGFNDDEEAIITYPYWTTYGGKTPRYYQRIAINRTVEHIAKGNKRALLVMATGTGKTFTAFQIIYRFWKLRKAKKILFLADRNILVDQTMRKDFAPFLSAMVKFDNDIAGIRVICSFTSDIYRIADMISEQRDIKVLGVKDYITFPKASGYKSYHMIVSVPVYLSDRIVDTKVEIQIRTVAMDFWASLEHKIHYKFEGDAPDHIKEELVECAHMVADLDARMLSLNEEILELAKARQE